MHGIIDTATEIVAIEGEPCFTCEWPVYDIEPSLEAGTATLRSFETTMQYGQTQFRGAWARELFCVSLASCVDIDFFYIYY